jgi:ribonucleoside-diphosphate reductase alpha chain
MTDNIGYLNVVAAFQKYVDMSISANTFYNYSHYENKLIPDTVILKEILYAYSMGIKNMYYCYSEDEDKDLTTNKLATKEDSNDCSGGACKL